MRRERGREQGGNRGKENKQEAKRRQRGGADKGKHGAGIVQRRGRRGNERREEAKGEVRGKDSTLVSTHLDEAGPSVDFY